MDAVLILGIIVAVVISASLFGWIKYAKKSSKLEVSNELWKKDDKKIQKEFDILSQGVPSDSEFLDDVNSRMQDSNPKE